MESPLKTIWCDAEDCKHFSADRCAKREIDILLSKSGMPTCASYESEPEPEEPPTWPCCGTCRFLKGNAAEGPQICGNPGSRVYDQEREYSWWCKCWTDGSE